MKNTDWNMMKKSEVKALIAEKTEEELFDLAVEMSASVDAVMSRAFAMIVDAARSVAVTDEEKDDFDEKFEKACQ
jgi:hypothetical protein